MFDRWREEFYEEFSLAYLNFSVKVYSFANVLFTDSHYGKSALWRLCFSVFLSILFSLILASLCLSKVLFSKTH